MMIDRWTQVPGLVLPPNSCVTLSGLFCAAVLLFANHKGEALVVFYPLTCGVQAPPPHDLPDLARILTI